MTTAALLLDTAALQQFATNRVLQETMRQLLKDKTVHPQTPATVLSEALSGDRTKDTQLRALLNKLHGAEPIDTQTGLLAGELRMKTLKSRSTTPPIGKKRAKETAPSGVDATIIALAALTTDDQAVVITADTDDLNDLASHLDPHRTSVTIQPIPN